MIYSLTSVIKLQRFKASLIRGLLNLYGVMVLRGRLRPMQKQTVLTIARTLGLSYIKSNWIYLQSLFAFISFGQRYAGRSFSSTEQILEEAKEIIIEGESHAEAALSTGKPLLIATIHMGDFQLGFLRLMEHYRPQRKTFLFKLNTADKKEAALMKAFERVVAAPTVLRVNENGGKTAYLALRQSNIVVLTIDLEVQVKSRSVVDFFGKPCYMQNGPATIAALSKALVVPVVTYKDVKGNKIVRVEPVIDSDAIVHDEPIQQRVDRVTQQLAKCLQQWLVTYPSQAHVWTSIAATMAHPLPSLSQSPATGTADAI
jgi:KDO2-lipid IV(A) lauroyltransferase